MSKSTYQNIRAQQRRITKRTNLFISQHNKLVNIGMAVFFLLLLCVATGLPSKITRSIQGSKPTNEASTISSNAQKATIDKKNPASTATPAAAPPTPAQTTNTQPSYAAPAPVDCISINSTEGGIYEILREGELKSYFDYVNLFLSMNKAYANSFPAAKMNQISTLY